VTLDVEEDMPEWRIADPATCENVRALPRFAELCRDLGVKPTYLCTYPVVRDPAASAILRELVERGDCEIGAHLHPWNTPPYLGIPGSAEDERKRAYYLRELGPELFRKKVEVLRDAVAELIGSPPVSFRAGRFGIDAATLAELPSLGFHVDSSVTPLVHHREDDGPDFRSAPQIPYRPSKRNVCRRGDVPIVELPVSVTLTRRLPRWARLVYVYLPPVTRIRGLLSRDYLGFVDFAWLYPARFDAKVMKRAARALRISRSPLFNVFLHSSELVAGAASPYVRTSEHADLVFARLREILRYCIEELGAVPQTMAETAAEIARLPEFAFERPSVARNGAAVTAAAAR